MTHALIKNQTVFERMALIMEKAILCAYSLNKSLFSVRY